MIELPRSKRLLFGISIHPGWVDVGWLFREQAVRQTFSRNHGNAAFARPRDQLVRGAAFEQVQRHLYRGHPRLLECGESIGDCVARDAVVTDLALTPQRLERLRPLAATNHVAGRAVE